jgi:cytochrome c553
VIGIAALGFVLGFVVIGRHPLDGPVLDVWAAFCRSLGVAPDTGAAGVSSPIPRTASEVAWTRAILDQVAAGDAGRGAFVALNCAGCHGEGGVSASDGVPTLAGLDAASAFKELSDFRSGKRQWGVMNGIAQALSVRDLADVAAYYAQQPGGVPALSGLSLPRGGRGLRAQDPALRLVFAGDPARGIAPCAACHGPTGYKVGAPALERQRAGYIEGQGNAFAQGIRHNDINEQMRVIAARLTPSELHAVAIFYGVPSAVPSANGRSP